MVRAQAIYTRRVQTSCGGTEPICEIIELFHHIMGPRPVYICEFRACMRQCNWREEVDLGPDRERLKLTSISGCPREDCCFGC